MASPYMLIHCDGAFGCNCPRERIKIAAFKRRQSQYAAKSRENQKRIKGEQK